MNKQTKRIVGIGVVILVIILVIVIAVIVNNKTNEGKQGDNYTQKDSEGNTINTSEALKKERTMLGYTINNISLKTQEAQTIFSLDIFNGGTAETVGKMVDIVFLDKEGKEVSKMALYIRAIQAGEKITTQSTVNHDFTNVYDFKLVERNT